MTFDELALDQWETDGGRAFPSDDFPMVFRAESALSETYRASAIDGNSSFPFRCAESSFHPNGGTFMTLQDKEIVVHTFHADSECEYSGKSGEAVEISTADGTIQHAIICIGELTKLLRFRHRQGEKQHANGNGQAATA